jgi:hypothetical protein
MWNLRGEKRRRGEEREKEDEYKHITSSSSATICDILVVFRRESFSFT